MRPTLNALCMAALIALCNSPTLAASDAERIRALEAQLEQQKAMLEQQQRMLQSMEEELRRLKSGTAPAPREDGTDPVIAEITEPEAEHRPGVSFEESVDGTLSAKIYGFAQADAIYDFKRVDPDWNDTLRVTTIPTRSGTYGDDGEVVFGVRQSRLGISGNYGPDITFLLEAELFGVGGDEGQTTPRLRHAWATYRNFGMGQYWSNFMDADVFPNTIDYWGPTGMVFYRNQQARYTIALEEDEFSISLEDPGTALTVGRFRDLGFCDLPEPPPDCGSIESSLGDLFQAHNDLPDLALRYRNNGDFGHYQVAGIARKLGFEARGSGDSDEEYGWGINASTVLNTFGNDKLKLQLVYGEGIGNYMNDGGVDIAPDSADLASASAETVPLLGIVAYYDHYWNARWSTSLGWTMTDLDTSAGQADSEFETGQLASINLLHYPADNVLMGTEFGWGQREDVGGNTGSDYRIQFTLKVGFDSGNFILR